MTDNPGGAARQSRVGARRPAQWAPRTPEPPAGAAGRGGAGENPTHRRKSAGGAAPEHKKEPGGRKKRRRLRRQPPGEEAPGPKPRRGRPRGDPPSRPEAQRRPRREQGRPQEARSAQRGRHSAGTAASGHGAAQRRTRPERTRRGERERPGPRERSEGEDDGRGPRQRGRGPPPEADEPGKHSAARRQHAKRRKSDRSTATQRGAGQGKQRATYIFAERPKEAGACGPGVGAPPQKKGGLASAASGPPTAPPLGPDPLPSYRFLGCSLDGMQSITHTRSMCVCVMRPSTVSEPTSRLRPIKAAWLRSGERKRVPHPLLLDIRTLFHQLLK